MARYTESHESRDVVADLYRRDNVVHKRVLELERRKHIGVWFNPDLLNGWANAGGTYHPIQYRLMFNDTLQYRGTISGGTSGTVAFILPEPHRPLLDISFLTDISDGVNFSVARVFVEAATGEVTVSYPAV